MNEWKENKKQRKKHIVHVLWLHYNLDNNLNDMRECERIWSFILLFNSIFSLFY